jgi:hypothetical protein
MLLDKEESVELFDDLLSGTISSDTEEEIFQVCQTKMQRDIIVYILF